MSIERAALDAGDYAVLTPDGGVLAAVERNAISDLAASLNNGSLVFELARLATLPRAAVVVEDRYSALLKQSHAPAGFLPDLLARVQVRYPEIPIVLLETRPWRKSGRFAGSARPMWDSRWTDPSSTAPGRHWGPVPAPGLTARRSLVDLLWQAEQVGALPLYRR